ncbi:MAG TPA: DegT/DnrJ/EryC1/StrS family aminotransferase [Glycomyces sp.]|nr:DegT/DnrJ/EryC1/StrS family aminotransferase [Glycomyces sp.]
MTAAVPFAAFDRRFQDAADDLVDSVRDAAESDLFILKDRCAALEERVAERTGARNAVACANGTGALLLSLAALGVGPGDQVLTPAFSYISSASTIALLGAEPVFVDVDPASMTLGADAVAAAIGPRTKAVVPVHLFSRYAPMSRIAAVAGEAGVPVVEDAAVALGSEVDGRSAGRWGATGVYSFFPAKPLGGCGDAGMVVTDDDALASLLRALRNHGQTARFHHEHIGFNCRMDEVTAGFLLRRLDGLDGQLEARRTLAERYRAALAGLGDRLVTPPPLTDGQSAYTYVVRAADREGLIAHLADRGVETKVYYPIPLPLQPVFAGLGHRAGQFPGAERLARECLALPLYPQMRESEVDAVAEAVRGFYGEVGP